MKIKKISKKAGMGAWPSIIGGLIVVVIFLYVGTYIASGGIKEVRELQNKESFSNFGKIISTGWSEYSSTTTYWKLLGVPSEAWGIVFLDNNTAHDLRRFSICTPGQKFGPCITRDTRSILKKCDTLTDDICVCLVSLKTHWTPCGSFHTDPLDARKVIGVLPGANINTAYTNLKNWNQNKFLSFPQDELIDVVDCRFMALELNCADTFGRACLIEVEGRILTWIGSDSKDQVDIETLTATRPYAQNAWYLELDAAASLLPWIYNNESIWVWCP